MATTTNPPLDAVQPETPGVMARRLTTAGRFLLGLLAWAYRRAYRPLLALSTAPGA